MGDVWIVMDRIKMKNVYLIIIIFLNLIFVLSCCHEDVCDCNVRLLLTYNNKLGDSIKVVYKNINDKIYVESSRDTFFIENNNVFTDKIDFTLSGEKNQCTIDSSNYQALASYYNVTVEIFHEDVVIETVRINSTDLLDIPTHIPCYEKTIVTDTIIIE